MIKFFRKIRQKMLTENKFSKYLIYAIGEIILVVIGILIALQVNNWNTKRVNANSEQIILQDLNIELEGNISSLEKIIAEHQKSLDAAIEIRKLIQDPVKLEKETEGYLISVLNTMNYNWTYDPKLGILNSIINSGKMDLIQNKEIRYMLSSVQESIVDANESTEEIGDIRNNFYWPVIASKREVTDFESLNFKSKETFRNPEFIFWNTFVIAVRKEGLDEENELLIFLKNLNKMMKSELEK